MEGQDKPAPLIHPAYKRQLIDLLRALDALDLEGQQQAAIYLGLWAAMEASRRRTWQLEPIERDAKILGS